MGTNTLQVWLNVTCNEVAQPCMQYHPMLHTVLMSGQQAHLGRLSQVCRHSLIASLPYSSMHAVVAIHALVLYRSQVHSIWGLQAYRLM